MTVSAPAPAPVRAPAATPAVTKDSSDLWKAIAKEASLLFKRGEFAAAAERYRTAIASCGAAAQAASRGRAKGVLLTNLGTCLQKLGEYEEAERVFSEILRDDPGMPEARSLLCPALSCSALCLLLLAAACCCLLLLAAACCCLLPLAAAP